VRCDILTSLQQTSDSGYILGGRSFSISPFEKQKHQGRVMMICWIVKLDSKGKNNLIKRGGTDLLDAQHKGNRVEIGT